jgi:hypothetical protein
MSESVFQTYKRNGVTEMRPFTSGETLSDRVSISPADREAGSPQEGDYIARNPANHDDQWLVSKAFFSKNQFVVVTA